MLKSDRPHLLILGAGGHGRAVAESASLSGEWSEIFFVDDRWPLMQSIGQYKLISNIENLYNISNKNVFAIAAVGNNLLRERWHQYLDELQIPLATVIHPKAFISPSSKVERGVVIMAGCVIGTDTKIHEGVILNIGTLLDHDIVIEKYAHLSVGVSVAGGKKILQHTFLDVGSIIQH